MFTITTNRRTLRVEAITRKGAVHAAVERLENGERILLVRQERIVRLLGSAS